MPDREPRRVALAATGVANLASVRAAFMRAGAEPYLSPDPEDLAEAAFAVVPGVGAFGSAMGALVAAGMDEAIRDRARRGAPTLGVCAGMQVFFEGSEESPGVGGLGIAPGVFRRFPSTLPVPQLGWNRVFELRSKTDELRSSRQESAKTIAAEPGMVREGWAYFANSYRLAELPGRSEGARSLNAAWAEYGEEYLAALEGPGLLLCQFHPELSGPWGLDLIRRWLESALTSKGHSS